MASRRNAHRKSAGTHSANHSAENAGQICPLKWNGNDV